MAKKTTQSSTKDEQQKSNVGRSQSKILKNLAQKLSDDYYPVKALSTSQDYPEEDMQIQKINRIINESAKKLSNGSDGLQDNKEKKGKPSFDPPVFDGISNSKEKHKLLKEKIMHLERDNTKLKYKLELLHDDFQKEKTNLKKSVRELKSELRRTAPLTDAKIFSFSKELKEVVSAVESFSSESSLAEEKPKNTNPDLDDLIETAPPTVSIQSPLTKSKEDDKEDEPKKVVSQKESDKEKEVSVKEGKKANKKKKTIVAATTVAIALLVVITGSAISRPPEIDQELVDSYLEQGGNVQGVSVEGEDKAPTPSLIKEEEKNNIATYDETKWEVYRDEFLGFQVRYPDNVTDLLHTGNTTTFLRKDGYLFKMQRVSTQRSLDEYWEYIKNDGLIYEVEPTTISSSKALHLVLAEEIEFPGNRYLVEAKEHLYDVWYATPNDHFDDDDMKRVDDMVKSLRLL